MPYLERLAGGLLQVRAQQAFASQFAALQARAAETVIGADVYRSAGEISKKPQGAICGAPGCDGGWFNGWKRRRRPFFEEEWACSGRCLQGLIRRAVRRESADADINGSFAPHRHRVPLGLVLLAQGWITHGQLQAALEAQRTQRQGRLGDWLVQHCGVPEERVTRGLGLQWSCPVLSLEGFSPSAMALVIPPMLADELGLVAVRLAGKSLLYVAFAGSINAAAALAVQRMSGLGVESGLLGDRDFERARSAIQQADAVPLRRTTVPHQDALCAAIWNAVEEHQPIASRMVRVNNCYWLRLWLESGAYSPAGDIPADSRDVKDYIFSMKTRAATVQ